MARSSRSNKKQPAFDPSELTDLIFTPAVGSGVGSHLVGTGRDFPAPTGDSANLIADVTTVDKVAMTTVDTSVMATVAMDNMSTMDDSYKSTVDIDNMSTVDTPQGRELDALPKGIMLWITEEGSLVPERRVKPIRLAQDVISATEESVYDTLWTASTAAQSEGRDLSRVVQAGYDYLVKHTELSKRTVQRIVEKLIDKDFIAIERPADIYERSSTVYRVFSYQTILDRHIQKGRLHVAKLGPGFSYVRPLRETGPQ